MEINLRNSTTPTKKIYENFSSSYHIEILCLLSFNKVKRRVENNSMVTTCHAISQVLKHSYSLPF